MSVVVERALSAVFDDDGELRLEDGADGWRGFVREEDSDGDVAYYYVDTRPWAPSILQRVRVGEASVRNALIDVLEQGDAS